MIKWDWFDQMGSNETAIYSQTTFGQNTLGGRNTCMFFDDAIFRQYVFQITCWNILVSSLLQKSTTNEDGTEKAC